MRMERVKKRYLLGCLFLAGLIFIIDLHIPLGVASAVPYVIVILLTLQLPGKRFTVCAAILCTLLTYLGYMYSPTSGDEWKVFSNRSLAVFSIWVVTALSLQRKQSLDEIEASEQKFRAVAEGNPNAFLMADDLGEILYVNRKLEEYFGYRRDELIGHRVEMLIPESQRGHHRELRKNYMKQPGFRDMVSGENIRGLRKSGETFPIEIALNPIQANGRRVILGAIVDMTEHNKAEEALRKAEALENIQDLARAIAHEFSQPLSILTFCIGLIEEEGGASRNTERAQKAVDRITSLIGYLRGIIILERQDYLNTHIINLKASAQPVSDKEPAVRSSNTGA